MLRSNTNEVKQRMQDHVLSYFDEGHGWDLHTPKGALKEQLKSFDYMPTDYAKGLYMVQGGSFLIYYYDQREFLKNLLDQTEEQANKYSNAQVFAKYSHLVAKTIQDLVK